MAPKPTYKKILNMEIPNVTLTEDDYSYYQQYFTDKLKDKYNSKEPFSNQTPAFHIETQRINNQKRSEFSNNFRESHCYDRDYFFTAVNSLIDKSDDDRELVLSTEDLQNLERQDLNNQNLDDHNLVILKETSDQELIDANLVQTTVHSKNKDRIWQNNINIINSNWKFSFETLAQTFSNHFSEQAYEELKIEHGVLVKNLKDLEINHKNTKKELETATKENTNLDKKLTLNKQELATANKENVNLDKKLTLKEQELETTNKENANLDKKLSIKEQELESAKKENANLDKKFTLKKQELETAKKEIMNLDKKLSIKEKELETAKKENVNFNKKLTEKEHDYKESQKKIKDFNKKIESLKKE
ncbi:27527_t:CDS:2 [Dentiscutata erythropus]|uniref:27527_t:CDS:1 n=1 Tax=Dentiscutata erythropus TaxID=1348616 RepID=A0A9N9CLC9_9GLOM|nr:27527_t:CDS:2 [Dentiscutata erythropus]